MYEVRLHGRGGQGTVLAATILAAALVEEGKYVIAVPSFGFERRGAPVAAFLRMDTREIRQMTNIYEPDCIVCIDPTVSRTINIFEGVKPNATLVQTTHHPLSKLQLPPAITTVGLCDAVSIALERVQEDDHQHDHAGRVRAYDRTGERSPRSSVRSRILIFAMPGWRRI